MNKKLERIDLSLILPCFNESEHIAKSIPRIISVLENSRYSYEIILIDDKSSDNTASLIEALSKSNRKIKTFFHEENAGRGATVAEGIEKSRGEIVGFIDIDLEISPNYIPAFVHIIEDDQTDIVVGHRYYPYIIFPLNYALRALSSKVYSSLVKNVLKLPIHDTESGYKFFDRRKILAILPLVKDKHWFWDTEIIARSTMNKLKITEVPVLFLKNKDKTSTVNLAPDTIKYLLALYRFKRSIK